MFRGRVTGRNPQSIEAVQVKMLHSSMGLQLLAHCRPTLAVRPCRPRDGGGGDAAVCDS